MTAIPRRVLVTGGAGYLGERVVRELVRRGHSVRVLDRVLRAETPYAAVDAIDYQEGDLLDRNAVAKALRGVDAVAHLAAIVVSRPPKDEAETRRIWSVNHDATVLLLEEARRAKVERFFFASTCSNYEPSPRDRPATETSALAPTTPYAESKVAAERQVAAARSPDFHPTILRFASVFGASPRPNFAPLLNAFVKEALTTARLTVYAPQACRPFLHVADAARAVAEVMTAAPGQTSGEVFNVGDDALNVTKEEVARCVAQHVSGLELVLEPGKSDPRDYCVSFQKIRTTLGFQAAVGIEQGVRELVAQVLGGTTPVQGVKA